MTPAVRSPRAISCAPVRVATSMMASGNSWLAATMPSAMTRRPSASVLRTSTVLPPNMVRTSAGRWAAPEGMFSAMHSQAVALTGRPRPARASTVLRTTAAPAMSHFMSPMPRAGLMEMPPVSKVMPLPTRAILAVALAGEYSTFTRRGCRVEPLPTPRMPPKPSFSRRFSSQTVTLTGRPLESSLAASAKDSG